MKTFSGSLDQQSNKTPPPPVRTPDNLRSKDRVEMILALCEGPIYGLKNGHQSILVNGTPLEDTTGNSTIGDYAFRFLPGASVDEVVRPVLGGFSNPVPVGLQMLYNSSRTVRIPAASSAGPTTSIGIRMVINQLYIQNNEGIFGGNMEFRIDYKLASDTNFSLFANTSVAGKTTSSYVKELIIPIASTTEAIDIRITKLSADSDGVSRANDLSWESVEAISKIDLAFPNVALFQILVTGNTKFTSLPDLTSICRGKIVNIPNGYNGLTRTWSGGLWDGTFVQGYTNNPAWVLYDFVNNSTYGLNAYYPVVMSKWDCFDIASWCDDRIAGIPRFSFNLLLASLTGAKELAQYIAGSFNGVFFDDGAGTAILRVDRPSDAVALFSFENVVEGKFSYSFTDITERYNDITVAYVDPELNYVENRVRVFNQTHIDTFGRIPLDFIAVGCTDPAEAYRRGMYRLETYLTETMSVQFSTNRQAAFLNPFDIILISDVSMGYGIHGRLQSWSEDKLTLYLRDAIYLEVGFSYVINVNGINGIERHNLVAGQSGSLTTLSISSALGVHIPEQAVFSIESADFGGIPKPFRVTRIEETSPDSEVVTLTCSEVNRNKWTAVEDNTFAWAPTYTSTSSTVAPPTNLHVRDVSFTATDGTLHSQLRVDWTRPSIGTVNHFEVQYRITSDVEWSPTVLIYNPDTSATVVTLRDRTDYTFQVRTVNNSGDFSTWIAASGSVLNATPPRAPTGLTVVGINSGLKLTWTNPTNANIKFIDIWESTSSSRSIATSVMQISGTTANRLGLAGGDQRWYWIRAVDYSGNYSAWNSDTGTTATATAVGTNPYDIAVASIQKSQLNHDLTTSIEQIPVIATAITTETNSRIAADSSLSSRIDTVSAAVSNATSIITTEQTTRAAADAAAATSITTLSSTVNSNNASVQTLSSTVNGLSAQYTVKLDVNGRVAGFGLASYGPHNADFMFEVNANRFAIRSPSNLSTVLFPFVVESGIVYIDGAQINNASIENAAIKNLTIDGTKLQDLIVRNETGYTGSSPTVSLWTTGNPVLLLGGGYVDMWVNTNNPSELIFPSAVILYLTPPAGIHTWGRDQFMAGGAVHGAGSASFVLTSMYALELKK